MIASPVYTVLVLHVSISFSRPNHLDIALIVVAMILFTLASNLRTATGKEELYRICWKARLTGLRGLTPL